MTKKISVWLSLFLMILACVITFQLTVIFGGGLMQDKAPGEGVVTTDPAGTEDPTTTEAPDATTDPTLAEELTTLVGEKLAKILDLYERYYVGELDVDQLAEGVIEGVVAYAGDKYGAYHPEEEYEELTTGYAGEFAGIGVSVIYNSTYGAIEILNVMPDSPALDAGLLPDDLIIGVEGEDVVVLGYDAAVNRIRGEIGTDVTLTVARGENYTDVFDVTLTRREVVEQSVTYEELQVTGVFAPVAYIRLMDFDDKTAEQFKDAMGEGASSRVRGYIIDLRNNGGGELSSIVEILDFLLPEGPIVRIQYKDGTERVYESDAEYFNTSIVVLTNNNTASAAELFVSALRDYNKAIVVGDTTYGKGTVQSIIELGDGSALRLSTSMYAPPYSENYEGVGITPDIQVSLADEYKNINLFKLDYENDTQLQAAVKLFQ